MQFKSRAWDKKNNKFVYDYVVAPTGHIEINIDPNNIPDPYGSSLKIILYDLDFMGDWSIIDWTDWRAIEDYEVTWFFGQKDKNDQELYEGDYVLVPKRRHRTWSGSYFHKKCIAEIIFKDDKFYLKNNLINCYVLWQDFSWKKLEKIGNKYEDKLEDLYIKYNIK